MDGARIPFTPEDERKIASAATWGSIVAIASVVGGGISTVASVSAMADLPPEMSYAMIPAFAAEVFVILINVWLLQACQAFRKVAVTDEADQAYLLAGFKKLRAYFMLQVIMILVVFALAIFGGMAAFAMLN